MWKDFKEFALQGNVIDLAVAVIIGAAFGKIVSSLVDNIVMPLIGGIFKGISFENLVYYMGDAEIAYGIFIQSVFNFFVIALFIFLALRFVLKRKKEEEVEEIDTHEVLLTEIRDILKTQTNRRDKNVES